jgi:hypothetical protein
MRINALTLLFAVVLSSACGVVDARGAFAKVDEGRALPVDRAEDLSTDEATLTAPSATFT